MKKTTGCPADGIEGFRLFMIGQREKPEQDEIIPYDIIRQLAAIHKKKQGVSPAKLLAMGAGRHLELLSPPKRGAVLNKNYSSRQNIQLETSKSKSKDDDSDRSLGDINDKRFLSTLELANEKIAVYKKLFYNKKPNFEKENLFLTE
jgi:hypothetical protein